MCKFNSMITAVFKLKILRDKKPENRIETAGRAATGFTVRLLSNTISTNGSFFYIFI